MSQFRLVCHPERPAAHVRGVEVTWRAGDGVLHLDWQIAGASAVVLPDPAAPGRHDGLWHHTCCELFVQGAGTTYREFNLSPSGQWAAYHFASYRQSLGDWPLVLPAPIAAMRAGDVAVVRATLPLDVLAGATAAGLCAVIEEAGGQKSYWALTHAPGPPDFHSPACFALSVAAAGAP